MGEVKEIPASEVLKHKSKDDLWLIIHHNGKVLLIVHYFLY